jgi:hypothetical protein
VLIYINFAFTDLTIDEMTKFQIGWLYVGVICFGMFVNVVNLIYGIVSEKLKLYMLKKEKKRLKKK